MNLAALKQLEIYRLTIYRQAYYMDGAMTETERNPHELLPLHHSEFHILLPLTGGSLHGYRIMQQVGIQTEGKMRMGPGTLYGAIKRLLTAALIEEDAARPDPEFDDSRRRYYRLTSFGRKVVIAEAKRLNHLVQIARTKRLLPNTGDM